VDIGPRGILTLNHAHTFFAQSHLGPKIIWSSGESRPSGAPPSSERPSTDLQRKAFHRRLHRPQSVRKGALLLVVTPMGLTEEG
jgi:hypothetical protein